MSFVVVIASIVLAVTAAAVDQVLLAVGALVVALLAVVAAVLAWRQRVMARARFAQSGQADRGWQRMSEELRRARRHDRRLTVCRVVPRPPVRVEALARRVAGMVRADDVCIASDGVVYLGLVESQAPDRVVARLDQAMSRTLDSATVSLATFPDDGISIEALRSHARLAPECGIGAGGIDEAGIDEAGIDEGGVDARRHTESRTEVRGA